MFDRVEAFKAIILGQERSEDLVEVRRERMPMPIDVADAGTFPAADEVRASPWMLESLTRFLDMLSGDMCFLDAEHPHNDRDQYVCLYDRHSADAAIVEAPDLPVAVSASDGLDVAAQPFPADVGVFSDLSDRSVWLAELPQRCFQPWIEGDFAAMPRWFCGGMPASGLTRQSASEALRYAASVFFGMVSRLRHFELPRPLLAGGGRLRRLSSESTCPCSPENLITRERVKSLIWLRLLVQKWNMQSRVPLESGETVWTQ